MYILMPLPAPYFDIDLDGWVVSRYAEVRAILDDIRFVPALIGSHQALAETSEETRCRHARMKAGLTQLREPIVMPAIPKGRCDLIRDVLKPWCVRLASEAVGVAADPRLGQLADAVFLASAFPYDGDLASAARVAASQLSGQIKAENPLALQAFIALATSLPCFVANACAMFFREPERAEPELLPQALEECFRLGGPAQILFRKAACDIGDIRRNDTVLAMIGTANRDPAVFADPDVFNSRRHPNPHLAFGRGAHGCIGAPLIRSISLQLIHQLSAGSRSVVFLKAPEWQGVAMRFLTELPALIE